VSDASMARAGVPTLPAGRRFRRGALATGVTLLLLLSMGSALGSALSAPHALPSTPLAATGAGPALGSPSSHTTAAHPAAPRLAPSLPPSPTRRGVFFQTSYVPNPDTVNQTSYYGTLENVTNEPSVNYTSTGLIATAYTAYTSASPCGGGAALYAKSEIGFVASKDQGASWSSPRYLGNPVCTGIDGNYSSAYQPTLTSLANGTLVLAYIEFNVSAFFYAMPYLYFGPYTWSATYDRLVVTESYNNGTSWTRPTVLNSSINLLGNRDAFAPTHPWATATGQTIYITWTNATSAFTTGYVNGTIGGNGSSAVHLIVSKNGGSTWGAPTTLRVYPGNGAYIAENSMAITGAAGELLITYTSNVSERVPWCTPGGCFYYVATASVIAATSANNGTSFTYRVAAPDVMMVPGYARWQVYTDPSPQIAYAPSTGALAIAYSAYTAGTVCYYYGCYLSQLPQVFTTNSSDGGATWTTARIALPTLDGLGKSTYQVYNPAIAYDGAGVLHLAVAYFNNSQCLLSAYGYLVCGTLSEEYASSATNGRSFSPPILISDNVTPYASNPNGEYATLVTAGSAVFVAWTVDVCPNWSFSSCYWISSTGVAEVAVSSLFQGTGLSISFNETGITNGTIWSAEVMGNIVSGSAPTVLTVTGIPSGENLTWNVSNISGGYGIRYIGAMSLQGPWTVSANITVYDNFSEQVLVNINTEPTLTPYPYTYYYCGYGQGFYWNYPACSKTNYNITPNPGANWERLGTSVSASVTYAPPYCGVGYYCYDTTYLNLTFDSWAGSGNGSVSTNSNATTFVVNGPINETATFKINGWCFYYFYGTPFQKCMSAHGELAFVESGLPAGVPWSVSIWSGDGKNFTTNSSTSTALTIGSNATLGPTHYAVWTVPDGAAGYWVGRATPVSPVTLPAQALVDVTFTLLANTTGLEFPLQVNQTGLPNGTAWSSSLDGAMYGVRGPSLGFTVGGGSHALNASPVYFDNGTGYYAAGFDVLPLVQNGSWSNTTTVPLAALAVQGATFVTVVYQPLYWLTATASVGGSVTPGSEWIRTGAATTLTATAAAGYYFVGWTGNGAGAITSTVPTITVHPTAPVRELATFEAIPAPLWTVVISESGLPLGVPFTVGLGPRSYTGMGPFNVSGLATGSYALTVPYVYFNGSNETRFVPTVSGSSFTMGTGGLLDVAGNGTLAVTFTTQYLVTVGATGNGTVSPSPGSYWVTAGASFPLVATPDRHYKLVAWNGSGIGAVNSPALSVAATVGSPLWETAQFVWAPTIAPATFELTVQESGLPGNLAWGFSVGTSGAVGALSALTVGGLNGSYTLTVAPVAAGIGVRYIANMTANSSESVTSNQSITVSFIEQFQVTVTGGIGGTVSPSGILWVDKGSSITLTASPNATSLLRSWNGTGTIGQDSTSRTITLTVTAPVTERATFAPSYPVVKSGSTTAGAPMAFGLLVALLVVGLVIGLIVGRRRGPPPGPAPAWSVEQPVEPDAEPGTESPEYLEGPAE
jgi:uncharacterized repeat protein (TIGR02543 family)